MFTGQALGRHKGKGGGYAFKCTLGDYCHWQYTVIRSNCEPVGQSTSGCLNRGQSTKGIRALWCVHLVHLQATFATQVRHVWPADKQHGWSLQKSATGGSTPLV